MARAVADRSFSAKTDIIGHVRTALLKEAFLIFGSVIKTHERIYKVWSETRRSALIENAYLH